MSELVSRVFVKSTGKYVLAVLATVITSALIYNKFTPYMAWASVAYFTMTLGLVLRRNKTIHAPLMVMAIAMDITLVLILELSRDAIATASSFTLSFPQQLHIGFSTLATICYFPMLYMGIKLYRSKKAHPKLRKKHRMVGIVTYIFRTLGFIMMFSLISHVK